MAEEGKVIYPTYVEPKSYFNAAMRRAVKKYDRELAKKEARQAKENKKKENK